MWSCCMPGRYIPNSAFLSEGPGQSGRRHLHTNWNRLSCRGSKEWSWKHRRDFCCACQKTEWPGIIHIPFCVRYSQLNHWNISGLQLDESFKITGIMFYCIYFSHCVQKGLRNTKFEFENHKEERMHPSDTVKCFYLPGSQWSSTELLSQPDWLTVM